MNQPTGSRPLVALGVSGGIAAYKAAELCSLLIKAGLEVQVVMTENAGRFVGEQTFLTLSRRPVITSLWEVPDWRPEHVALAAEAALLVIAPCTANVLGKLANGIADDALSTLAISIDKPPLLAPAMNPVMWKHPAVRHNVEILRQRGAHLIGPDSGRVACGEDGVGRMSEPAAILEKIKELLGRA
jgi:phosphopantothenoylcysteine decarboxylase/phosphopantothenate--cysteine ligase